MPSSRVAEARGLSTDERHKAKIWRELQENPIKLYGKRTGLLRPF